MEKISKRVSSTRIRSLLKPDSLRADELNTSNAQLVLGCSESPIPSTSSAPQSSHASASANQPHRFSESDNNPQVSKCCVHESSTIKRVCSCSDDDEGGDSPGIRGNDHPIFPLHIASAISEQESASSIHGSAEELPLKGYIDASEVTEEKFMHEVKLGRDVGKEEVEEEVEEEEHEEREEEEEEVTGEEVEEEEDSERTAPKYNGHLSSEPHENLSYGHMSPYQELAASPTTTRQFFRTFTLPFKHTRRSLQLIRGADRASSLPFSDTVPNAYPTDEATTAPPDMAETEDSASRRESTSSFVSNNIVSSWNSFYSNRKSWKRTRSLLPHSSTAQEASSRPNSYDSSSHSEPSLSNSSSMPISELTLNRVMPFASMTGWLLTLSPTTFNLGGKAWKRRYCVLSQRILYIYKSPSDEQTPIDRIDVDSDTKVFVCNDFPGKLYVMRIVRAVDERTSVLQAQCADDLTIWLRELKQSVLDKNIALEDPVPVPTLPTATLPPILRRTKRKNPQPSELEWWEERNEDEVGVEEEVEEEEEEGGAEAEEEVRGRNSDGTQSELGNSTNSTLVPAGEIRVNGNSSHTKISESAHAGEEDVDITPYEYFESHESDEELRHVLEERGRSKSETLRISRDIATHGSREVVGKEVAPHPIREIGDKHQSEKSAESVWDDLTMPRVRRSLDGSWLSVSKEYPRPRSVCAETFLNPLQLEQEKPDSRMPTYLRPRRPSPNPSLHQQYRTMRKAVPPAPPPPTSPPPPPPIPSMRMPAITVVPPLIMQHNHPSSSPSPPMEPSTSPRASIAISAPPSSVEFPPLSTPPASSPLYPYLEDREEGTIRS
ncbi:uncharacterized protein VTP21DRAFT_4175 [Calcarisporiella thermophila]|uniref:uncharacterized protein n=1 Tax=Calcarisporiella thermophila TaxID=911321 RepID=UPI003743E55A